MVIGTMYNILCASLHQVVVKQLTEKIIWWC